MASTYGFTTRILLLAGLLIALFVNSSFAHTYLSSVYLDGAALSEGDCVRPHPDQQKEYPIPLVTAADMTCGWLPAASGSANRKCPIAAGSTIGIQWHHNSISASDDILEATHKGPIQYFLAKSETGAGNVWFKIYEDGYSASEGKWATDKMIANRGRMDIKIPSDIAPGNYLLRGEILALHNAYAVNGIQPYVGCVELTISGSGSANPAGVAFPGYYTPTGPGMLFDVYSPYSSYTIPGPALYVPGTAPTTKPTSAPTTTPTSAPTTKPTTGSSTSPTTRPTSAPTTVPTTAPSSGTVKVQLNGGSSVWWLGVIVYGGSETVVKVEITDSGSVSTWKTLVDMSYAFVYNGGNQLTLPISVRVTSASGKQVTANNVFTSFGTDLIDTGKSFSSTNVPASTPAPPAPTSTPTSPASPTTTPTNAPTTTPSGTTKITLLSGVSEWWFAMSISGNSEDIAKVELKDAGALSSYVRMTSNSWGWAYPTQGSSLVTPLTVRVTSNSGKTVTATVSSINSGLVVATNGSL